MENILYTTGNYSLNEVFMFTSHLLEVHPRRPILLFIESTHKTDVLLNTHNYLTITYYMRKQSITKINEPRPSAVRMAPTPESDGMAY